MADPGIFGLNPSYYPKILSGAKKLLTGSPKPNVQKNQAALGRDTVQISNPQAPEVAPETLAATSLDKIQATLANAYSRMMECVNGEFRLSGSHGCIHIPTDAVYALGLSGAGNETRVTIHNYDQLPPKDLPPVLTRTSAKRYNPKDLHLVVYPGQNRGATLGGEIAILYHRGKPIGYFKVGCGPRERRTASDNKPAVPTPRVSTTLGGPVGKGSSSYLHSNIPGGALVRFDFEKKEVYYSTDKGKNWKLVTNKKLAQELLDPERRQELTQYRDAFTYLYTGNDFTGAGFIGKNGDIQEGKIWKMKKPDGGYYLTYFHGGPSSDADKAFVQGAVDSWLRIPGLKSVDDIILPLAEEAFGSVELYNIYLKISQGKELTSKETLILQRDQNNQNAANSPAAEIRQIERLEEKTRIAHNFSKLRELLMELTPHRKAMQAYMQQGGLGPEHLNLTLLMTQILEGIDPDIARVNADQVGVVNVNMSGSDEDYQEFEMTEKELILVVYKDGGKVTSLAMKITRKDGETVEELYARLQKALPEAKQRLKVPLTLLPLAEQKDLLESIRPGESLEINLYASSF